MKTDKYKDLKIGQRVWFNPSDDDFPIYVPIIIDKIFPPNKFDDGYIHGTADDGTCEKYKIYFEELIIEDPKLTTPKQIIEHIIQHIEELKLEIQELKNLI